jgi:hypothetical protein
MIETGPVLLPRHRRRVRRRHRRPLPPPDGVKKESASQSVPSSPSAPTSPVLREEKPVPTVRKLFTSLPDYFARDAEAWVHAIANPGGPSAQQLSGNTVKSYHDGMATFEKWLWDYWGGASVV